MAIAAVTGLLSSAARAGLYATGLWSRNGASTIAPDTFDRPATPAIPTPSATPSTGHPRLPSPVLVPVSAAPRADPAKVRARIARVSVEGAKGKYSALVLDVGSGKSVFAHQARTRRIPASTLKLLTTSAALSALGPDHRFQTRVVATKKRQLVLVGGGDPYLSSKAPRGASAGGASLSALALTTATRLKAGKVKEVTLGYDASLFAGPAWNPRWPDFYADQVTRTSALWADEGRLAGSGVGPRAPDPAKAAAKTFATALRKHGVAVRSVRATRAPRSAQPVAQVSSLPLGQIVERLLMASDNDASEVLLRQLAVAAERPGSTVEGLKQLRAQLRKIGAWEDGTRLYDGSGLARENRVSARTMATVLRIAAEEDRPRLRAVITGLPVAGVEGSLRVRFFADAALAGRGVVRGKTGTLRDVHTLAGIIRTKDGSVVSYAFLVNDPKNEYAARVWLDDVTSAISQCGCR